MTFDPAIRNRSLGAAMTLMERADPMQAMAEMLAIAQVIERYEMNTLVPAEVEQPETAQAAINDQIPHTGEAVVEAVASAIVDAVREGEASYTDVARAAVAAMTEGVEVETKKVRTPKKAKKAKAAKKSKPVREAAGEPVPTPSQDSGNPVPANEDPVPGEPLQAAA